MQNRRANRGRRCPQCNAQMSTVALANRGVGWRFRCPNGHRLEATSNTFLQHVRFNGELGTNVIVQFAFMWLQKCPLTYIERELGVAHDTAVAWSGYFRDVATKIAWHDFRQLGGRNDIVEVDETHLFKRKYNVGRQVMWRNHWLVIAGAMLAAMKMVCYSSQCMRTKPSTSARAYPPRPTASFEKKIIIFIRWPGPNETKINITSDNILDKLYSELKICVRRPGPNEANLTVTSDVNIEGVILDNPPNDVNSEVKVFRIQAGPNGANIAITSDKLILEGADVY